MSILETPAHLIQRLVETHPLHGTTQQWPTLCPEGCWDTFLTLTLDLRKRSAVINTHYIAHCSFTLHSCFAFCILLSTLLFLYSLLIYLCFLVLMCSTFLMCSTYLCFYVFMLCVVLIVFLCFYVYCMHLHTRKNSK